MSNKIIYLHGFNSSSKSFKAQCLIEYMRANNKKNKLLVPDLKAEPESAIRQITMLIESNLSHDFCFIGSSLGGYYATWFAEKYNCPAVLINPSIRPYETLAKFIGENENLYTNEKWKLDKRHIQQLLDIEVNTISHPERYLVLLQTVDEILDYRQANTKFASSQLVVEQGGDHSFVGFDNHIEHILSFSGI